MNRTPALACCAIAAFSGIADAGLLDLIQQADAIAIAEVTPQASGPAGTHFILGIRQVLKGSVGRRNILASFIPANGQGATLDVAPTCGIFLLRQNGSQWRVIPQETPLYFDALYAPSDRCSAPGEDKDFSADRVVGEYVHSLVGTDPKPAYIYRLFSQIRSRESGEIAGVTGSLSSSENADLRALGLAWRIAEGDSAAVRQLAVDTAVLRRPPPIQTMLVASISVYSSVDRGGISGLGMIARSNPGGFLEQAVSYALRQIHTRDTLALAYGLLDSPTAAVRENAIAAFSMFVLQVPPLDEKNGAAIFERALNPSTRKSLGADEEAHIHFGRIADSGVAAGLTQWWKGWYARTSGGR
jgi:hypothetical protein